MHCELQRLTGNETLWNEWRDLLCRARPELRLFGPEWFSIWERTIGAQPPWTGSLHVAAVYDDDRRLMGVLPVGHPKVGLLKVNALSGYFQPWRVILADRSREYDVGRALAWFLIELNWNVLQLGPWPRSHATHRGMLSAFEELGIYVQRQDSCGLAIAEPPPTWEQFRSDVVGNKCLRKLRNYESKLNREHRLDVRHHRTPSADEARELIAALAHIERQSWLSRDPHGRPRFSATVDQAFWTELFERWLVPNGFLDCWLMSADEQPISFVFALTAGGTRYVVANQFDEAWSRFSTGSLLYRNMLEEGYRRGVTRYDFGTNQLHYKQQWGAAYLDHLDTYTVATSRLVSGFLQAGVKLKSLLNVSQWGRAESDGASSRVSGELAPAGHGATESVMADQSASSGDGASPRSEKELLVAGHS